MKINRLRLIGFKSFVEPTELAIEPGLTGVVGPNGCGKSNILEALRWVMGENSPKSMRGEGMEDVIFAGSAGRPARNSAEVLIGLDNSDRSAPAQFNDSEALEVVRRIEREAGSAYRINGREVRQRDVQLLFADASTGAHSPALVKQGQIAELINMKPKARRAILEEAAGISGLHSRRHEAELRLRAASTNLDRLNDVVQEIEVQLAGLKKQARQAARYRNISGDIRRAEALLLHLRWSGAEAQRTAAEERLEIVRRELAHATAEVASLTTEREAKAGVLPERREAEARAAAALQRLSHERDALAAEEARERKRAEETRARLEDLKGDLDREEGLAEEAQTEREALSTEAEALRIEAATRQSSRGQASGRAQEIAARVTAAEARHDDESRELNRRRGERERLSRMIEDLERRLARFASELQSIAAETASIAPSPEEEQALSGARGALASATDAAARMDEATQAAEAARQAAEAKERERRDALQDVERELGILRAEAETISRLLQLDKSDLWAPLVDQVKVEPGFEIALGAALGDDLAAPADEAAPIHWTILPPFVSAHPLPNGARALGERVSAPGALARRLSQIGIVDNPDIGRRLQKELLPGQRLVTRKGDLWRWDGYSASAEGRTPAAQRLEQHNRLIELEARIKTAGATASDARAEHQAARSDAEAAQADEATARRLARDARATLELARERMQTAERALSETGARRAALAANAERIDADQAEAKAQLDAARAELAALGSDADRIAQIQTLKETLQQARTELAEASAALQAVEREAAIANDRLARIASEESNWKARAEGAKARAHAMASRIMEAEASLAAAADLPALIDKKRAAILDAIGHAEASRSAAADALAVAEAELKVAERALKTGEQKLSEQRELRARLDAQWEAASERGREIGAQIREALGCAPEEALAETGFKAGAELPDIEATEARLERYRRERETLGGVNLRAEEEAAELQARLDTLTTEKADLEGAINKLRAAIGSLNREGRERILAAFDSVNAHFERLFTTLFEGGTAKLELIESDDPLEAGLEIFARPPGKRLTTLSLLSGGEQALTALSLIFAVFLSNPAPICVLDEVDAPLDDSNVDRYCNLLEQMARTTQTRFLVITHHPVTMARMDRLYGVTMSERGVSQLVSVDLHAAAALRAAE